MPKISAGNKEVREHLRSWHKGWTATRGNPLLPFAKEQRDLRAVRAIFFIGPHLKVANGKIKRRANGDKIKGNRLIRSQIWPKVYHPQFKCCGPLFTWRYTHSFSKSDNKQRIDRLSFDELQSTLHYIPTFCYWLKNLAPLSRPIRSKNQNRPWLALTHFSRACPRLQIFARAWIIIGQFAL